MGCAAAEHRPWGGQARKLGLSLGSPARNFCLFKPRTPGDKLLQAPPVEQGPALRTAVAVPLHPWTSKAATSPYSPGATCVVLSVYTKRPCDVLQAPSARQGLTLRAPAAIMFAAVTSRPCAVKYTTATFISPGRPATTAEQPPASPTTPPMPQGQARPCARPRQSHLLS